MTNNDLIVDGGIIVKAEERQSCEVWTRVMGYHRPTTEFNPGKKQEHADRMHFVEDCGCSSIERKAA